MNDRKQFCTFYLGRRLLGVDVLKIQEVIRFQELTEVPLAPPVIRGLLNLRGSIVSTIDLRRRFGMEPLTGASLPANVILQTGASLVSLMVDRIGDVVEVDPAQFEPLPDNLRRDEGNLIEGVYKLPGELLLILDVERVLELESAPA